MALLYVADKVRMCFQGRSRFCLICLLLYTWLPSGIQVAATVKKAEKTTYPSLNKTTIDHQTDHDHEVYQVTEVMPEMIDKTFYMSKLMEEYGNGTMMTFEGFEHLLQKLGLGKIVVFDHPVKCHKLQNGSNFQAFHKTHNHSYVIPGSENSNILCEDINNDVDTDHDDEAHEHGDEKTHDHIDEQTHTHIDELTHDHIDEQTHDQIDEHIHEDNHTHGEVNKLSEDIVNNEPPTKDSEDGSEKLSSHSKRDIPIKEKCLSAITFLNMGKGKDLRHLSAETFQDLCPSLVYHISQDTCHDHHVDFPHSIHSSNQVTDHDNHDDHHEHVNAGREGGLSSNSAKVWGYSTIAIVIISLVGLLGVAVIPIMQKVFYNHMLQFLVALAVGALSGDALLHLLPHAISGGHGQGAHGKEQGEDHTGPVYKGLCGLIGIYFFYLIERVLTIFTEMKRRKKQYRNRKNKGDEEHDKVGVKLASDCDEVMMSVHPNKALQGYADEAHSEHCMISFENTKALSHQHGTHKNGTHKHDDNDIEHEEEKVNMLSRSNSHGHGHSHAHGPTDSVAAIAWMVILGDGIHNFSDGLAIGAAFSNSITGGFSTSVAVFCHELPHEIGDFAMLLRAGMAPKQAIIYNCLSSVLCFIGMLIGVAIGNIENASLWIFAVVGGMFLYIALVDMLPEMSSVETKHGENPYSHLVLQMAGMLLGGGIMLVIALYEDRLKKVFD